MNNPISREEENSLTYIEYPKKLIEASSVYDHVFFLNLNFLRVNSIETRLTEYKKKIKEKQRVCFLMRWDEPGTFIPESKISLEIFDLIQSLKDCEVYGCDFLFFNQWENYTQTQIDFLNKNNYGWHFAMIDHDSFPSCKITEPAEPNDELLIENCQYNLSHLTFTQRTHRQLFSKFLIKENMVKNNLIAINEYFSPDTGYVKRNMLNENAFKPYKSFHTYECWFLNKNLLDIMNVELKYSKHPKIDNNYDNINLEFLSEAVLNITSETVFYYPYVELTEKTLQSILIKRPFILIGPAHSLKYLRSLGYKTFGKIIDESYDEIEDPNERMEKIMTIVRDFNNKQVEQNKKLLLEIKDDLLHNYFLLVKQIKNLRKTTEKGIIKYVNNRKNFN